MMPAIVSSHIDAEEGDELRLLPWIHETWENEPRSNLMYHPGIAARRGHLRALQWLRRHTPSSYFPYLIDVAAENGHLEMVEWMHVHMQDSCSVKAMDSAAENGHLHVVKWLHQNRREGCTTDAIESAASNGHLAVMEWLHANRTEGCNDNMALREATKNGHFEVVKWLVQNRMSSYSVSPLCIAATHGHLEILAWLHDRGNYTGTPATILCEITRGPSWCVNKFRPMNLAARDTIGWLNDRFSFSQQCHPSYCHFANNDDDKKVWGARVGDIALLRVVETRLMPVFSDCIRLMQEKAVAKRHHGILPFVEKLHDAYYRV